MSGWLSLTTGRLLRYFLSFWWQKLKYDERFISYHQDWISITYLFFISLVFAIVWSFLLEINMQRLCSHDECEKEIKTTEKGKLSLRLNKSYDPPSNQEKVDIKTPENFPSRRGVPSPQAQGPIKMIKSAKMIHCITENGITKCFARSSKETTRMVPSTSPTSSIVTQQSRILWTASTSNFLLFVKLNILLSGFSTICM